MSMIQEPDFEMMVVELFHFGDGQTIFVGDIQNHEELLERSFCQVFIENTLIDEFEIEGEMLPEKRTPNPYRSLSTRAKVTISREQIVGKACRLIGKIL